MSSIFGPKKSMLELYRESFLLSLSELLKTKEFNFDMSSKSLTVNIESRASVEFAFSDLLQTSYIGVKFEAELSLAMNGKELRTIWDACYKLLYADSSRTLHSVSGGRSTEHAEPSWPLTSPGIGLTLCEFNGQTLKSWRGSIEYPDCFSSGRIVLGKKEPQSKERPSP